jgi:ArsR family transcriptional regulator
MMHTEKNTVEEDVAEIMKAMGDKNRLHILSLLRMQELCVCEITSMCHLSQSNVSQHLARLRSVGLVRERKNAQWIYYSLNTERFPIITEILKLLNEPEEDISNMENVKNHPSCKP